MASSTTIITNQYLHDQIHDLTAKYDSLENQYKTTKLENKEYKHQIAVLHHQNKDLQKELNHYKDHHHNEQKLKPMLNAHINSIQSSLDDHDAEIQQLQETNQQYIQQLNNLKFENITSKEQIKKYRIALENTSKQKDVLKQIHNDTLAESNKQINQLEHELQLLRDQLESINAMKAYVSKPSTPSMDHYKAAAGMLPDRTPRIAFLRSEVEESPFQFANMFPRKNTVLSCHFTSNDSFNRSRRGIFDVEIEYEEKLEKLRMENAMLTKKLNVLQFNDRCEDEKCEINSGYEFVDDEDDDIMNEFNKEEIHELEELFKKCDQKLFLSPKRIEVKRYKKKKKVNHWIPWYHMFK